MGNREFRDKIKLNSAQHLAMIKTNTNEGKKALLELWGFSDKKAQEILTSNNLAPGYDEG
jgi:hypothetical protein